MADKTIDSEDFVLYDCFGAASDLRHGIPTDGMTGSTHHNVATAVYLPGTTITVRNESSTGLKGVSTFRYLQVGTQDTSPAIAVKTVCVPASTTNPYVVANNPDANILVSTGASAVAIALSAMTDAYYGWFWTGGPCPEWLVSGLGGTYPTDDSVVSGKPISVVDLTADALGFKLTDTAGQGVVGWAQADDA